MAGFQAFMLGRGVAVFHRSVSAAARQPWGAYTHVYSGVPACGTSSMTGAVAGVSLAGAPLTERRPGGRTPIPNRMEFYGFQPVKKILQRPSSNGTAQISTSIAAATRAGLDHTGRRSDADARGRHLFRRPGSLLAVEPRQNIGKTPPRHRQRYAGSRIGR
jgi:hypothetical protein